jgi:hypothetical protein
LITEKHSILVAVVIVVSSLILLAPRIAHPIEQTIVLLNETVSLTEDDYERQITLSLSEGDQVEISVSTRNQPVDLMIAKGDSASTALVDQVGRVSYDFEWTVPEDGPYVFTLIAETNNVDATITIAR